jgi:hypothetical protein
VNIKERKSGENDENRTVKKEEIDINLPQNISTSSHGLLAGSALPNASSHSFHAKQTKEMSRNHDKEFGEFHLRVFTTESTVVFGMLSNFHFLDDLSQCGTVSGSIFTANSSLLSMVCLKDYQII